LSFTVTQPTNTMSPPSPTLIFNFDISCPFAYLASTRLTPLLSRTNASISYRPVLLGAIYRSTAAPQGAGGSASDVFNSTKRQVTSAGMNRTLKRYKTPFKQPAKHPMKSVNALRLLYCIADGESRRRVMEGLFAAYWVHELDITNDQVLLNVAKECGVSLDGTCFANKAARKSLEEETEKAIQRGAFGVPGFWIPEANGGEGRFFWGQDRMHFVEATLLAMAQKKTGWEEVEGLQSLMPRCVPLTLASHLSTRTRLEFWFDFSSPWAYLGYTQLARMQHQFGPKLEIVLKPFLLGILFREIGAPNMPMLAVSKAKANWSTRDHEDWVRWWNAVNVQEGGKDKAIDFHWAEVFPIRTPTVLRVGIVEPDAAPLLCELLLL
jgi:2-hydroxychromene-2-carboxylate isomerase